MAILNRNQAWSVRCDYCGKDAHKQTETAGDASDNARKEGYTTVCVRAHMPMKWACPTCKLAIDKEKK
jgi:hypothetical protein